MRWLTLASGSTTAPTVLNPHPPLSGRIVTMTEDERERAADGLRRVLEDIEQGRLVASDAQAAYIAGALQALTQG